MNFDELNLVDSIKEFELLKKRNQLKGNYKEYYMNKAIYKLELGYLKTKFKQRHIETSPFYLNDKDAPNQSHFDDESMEDNDSNEMTVHSGHRMFDLHGFTTLGAEQALRRIFTSVDRSRQQVIKINVGTGSHSQDKKGKLPAVVQKVATQLQLPQPVKHEKNPGYLLMILPPIIETEG